MAEEFYLEVTEYGRDKLLESISTQKKFKAKYIAVGDSLGSYYEPEATQETLKNEKYRGEIYEQGKKTGGKNWDENYLYFRMQIPASEGDYTIREAALIDSEGGALAIAKYPETQKKKASDTYQKTLTIEMRIASSESAINTIVIDNSGTLATEEKVREILETIEQPDWDEENPESKGFIKNKPSALSEFENDCGYLVKEDIEQKADIKNLQYAPFSINSGVVLDGLNSTLTCTDTILACAPCVITTADNRTNTYESLSVFDIEGVSDGKYKVMKSYLDGSLSLVSNLSISKTEPAESTEGDYWLDYSITPLALKYYDGSRWVIDNDKVYLGNITVAEGVIVDVFNVDFNVTREGEFSHKQTTLFEHTKIEKDDSLIIDLSSVLPDDGFAYMVMFDGGGDTGTSSGNRYVVGIGWKNSGAVLCSAQTRTNSSICDNGSVWFCVNEERMVGAQCQGGVITNMWLQVKGYFRKGIV